MKTKSKQKTFRSHFGPSVSPGACPWLSSCHCGPPLFRPTMPFHFPIGIEFAFGKTWSILCTFFIADNGAVTHVAGIWDSLAPSGFSGWSGEWSFSESGTIHVYIDACRCDWWFHTDMFVQISVGKPRFLRNWMPTIMDGVVQDPPVPWSINALVIRDGDDNTSTLDSTDTDGFIKT